MFNASIISIKNKDEMVDKVEKQRAKSVSNRPNEITLLEKMTKPVEVIIDQDNFDLSVLSGLGASLSSIIPYQ